MESARSMVKERSWLPLTLVRASSRTLLRVSSSCILCMGTYAQHPVLPESMDPWQPLSTWSQAGSLAVTEFPVGCTGISGQATESNYSGKHTDIDLMLD